MRNVVFENCITGITVRNASKVNIIQNTMLSGNGIVVLSSSSINILGNNITLAHSSTGINFLPITPADSKPKQVRIEGNQIKGTNTQIPTSQMQPEQRGIWGEFSGSIIGNSLTSIKGNALYYTGSNNLITDNNFQYNYVGILFTGTADKCIYNRIYHNNFDRNGENVIVPFVNSAPKNYWNNDTTGNYWSDYFGVDANGDGIGDTPYILEISYRNHAQNRDATEERGRDNCPLMKRINISSIIAELNQNFSSQTQTPVPDDGTQPFNPLSFVVIGTIAVSVLVTAVYFRKKRV
jgi:nitrous oxidase accessory protein NosD